ncbi:tripartite tricarboxylate transporter TctB family protein [Aureimonas sp. AU22]|uniref:tripartite tricarboxylate transporter TctB family protein n=1 Tax=Aureimonas sp. AU22 TaxID=1638162 RepID=UPI0007810D33|nr:tripartite tricarboxylate transporter TctB family protein [Aureimonas sp. AU22]
MHEDNQTAGTTTTVNARDVATGIVLIGVSALGLYMNTAYQVGSSSQMGPGYMPLVVFTIVLALGVAILLTGLRNGPDPLEAWAIRELGLILGAMTVFGLLLERTGLAVSIILLVVISGLADRSQTVKGIAGLAVFLVALCWVVFILGLGLNVPFLPPALAN